MTRLLWICLGGAVGTGLRFGLQGAAARAFGAGFPYGTLAVNLIGSLLLGAIMQVGLTTELLSPLARQVLAVGVMGGFTTYSSFNYETLALAQQGAWLLASINVIATLAGCWLAGLAGMAGARWVAGA